MFQRSWKYYLARGAAVATPFLIAWLLTIQLFGINGIPPEMGAILPPTAEHQNTPIDNAPAERASAQAMPLEVDAP